jgi:carbonic anhydrase/acetyltransferase-like protein (isoleucine patch superfamily)
VIYDQGPQQPVVAADAFVAPNATIIGDVHLLPEASIWFGAILRGDIERITIGRGSNVQDGTVMHTDPANPCTLGEYVTVGHMAMLHGCQVGDHSLIGIGATLLNGSSIGSNSIVGAHTLITAGKQFPDGVLIMGTPGKIVRELKPADLTALRANAERYVARAQRYMRELKTRST